MVWLVVGAVLVFVITNAAAGAQPAFDAFKPNEQISTIDRIQGTTKTTPGFFEASRSFPPFRIREAASGRSLPAAGV